MDQRDCGPDQAQAQEPVSDAGSSPPPHRVDNIELLRLLAAGGVVLHHLGHYGKELAGVGPGWLAWPLFVGFPVPLFFVISGFVLAAAMERSSLPRYALARALRLYPGYWLAVGLLLLGRGLAARWDGHSSLAPVLPGAATLGLWPAGREGVPYFLGIEWSLVYEVFLSVALGVLVLGGRGRLKELTAIWLGLLCAKAIYWPDLFSEPLPSGLVIALSAFNAPFLAGMLLQQWRPTDRRLRSPALVVLPVLVAVAATRSRLELAWLWWGAAAVVLVWLATDLPQIGARHPLARLGGCTYGLFLLHVPLMLVALRQAQGWGWTGQERALLLAGSLAMAGGLAFGAVEAGLHRRLRGWGARLSETWAPAAGRALLTEGSARAATPPGCC